jgi:hypothetical protein
LPFDGAEFIGVVIPTVVGGLVIGLGAELWACEAPLEPELLLLDSLEPQAATETASAATTGSTIPWRQVCIFMSPPRRELT